MAKANSDTPPPLSKGFSSLTLTKEEEENYQRMHDHFTQLVSTFPSVYGGLNIDLGRHPDGWYIFPPVLAGCLLTQHCFKSRPTDIILASYPKSGTTRLKSLLFATVAQRNNAANPNDINHLTLHSPHECVPTLESQVFIGGPIPNLEIIPSPRLFHTHIPFRSLPSSILTSGCKIIYLCRGPKDNFISLWHFFNKFRTNDNVGLWSIEEAIELFCNGLAMFGSIWDHVLSYWQEHLENPNRVLFLTYEGLKEDPIGQVKHMAEFVGFPFTEEEEKKGVVQDIVEMCGIDRLSNLEVNRVGKVQFTGRLVENKVFFRRGEVNDWVNHLTPEMARRIDEVTESKFKGTGLTLM